MIKIRNILFGIFWAFIFQLLFQSIAAIGLTIFLNYKSVPCNDVGKIVVEQIKYFSNLLSILPIYLSIYLTITQKLPGTKTENWNDVDEIIDNFNVNISISLILQLFIVQTVTQVGLHAVLEALKYKSVSESTYAILFSTGLCTIVAYLYFYRMFRIKVQDELSFSAKEIKFLPILLLLILAAGIISSELNNIGLKYIPFKLFNFTKIYQQLFSGGIASILLVALIGPLFEEYFFRRILLKNLLGNYSPLYAIFISSILFACIHLNLQSFVSLVFIGLVLGAVYYFTDSLMYCFFIHGFHNFIVYLLINNIITLNVDGLCIDPNHPDRIVFQPLWLDLSAVGILALIAAGYLYARKKMFINNTTTW